MAHFMPSILALSVTDKIEQYGAYAGFAAVLGLAILSLLYFAQARELKRLREWAGRAPERAAELEARVQAEAQKRVAAQPVAQPQPAQQPRPAAAPATPAAQAQQAGAGAAAGTAGAAGVAAATAAGAAAKAAPAQAGAATATPDKPGTPPATTVQPAAAPANGGAPAKEGEKAPAPGDQQPKPAAPGAAPKPAVAPAAVAATAAGAATASPPQARPGQPLRMPSSSATVPPRAGGPARAATDGDGDGNGRGTRTVLAIVGGVAAVLVAGIVIATQVLGGGGDSGKPQANTIASTPASSGTSTTAGSTSTPVDRANTTVAVLNGTTVPGLARGVANKVQQAKFKIGNVTNAADQSRSATLVEYAAGKRREALLVARTIGVGPDAVQQLQAGTKIIAGEEAQVVVTVGADQNTQSP
jgi:hypothetical protein